MPYLTSSGRRCPAAGAPGRLGVGVPGYAHPLVAPAEWAELARPGVPVHWAVLNVARGPGTCPDPYCAAAVCRLGEAGVRALGHLDLRHGTRDFGDLVHDAHRYLDWYGVDGFYLDRCPAGRADLPDVERVVAVVRALGTDLHLVLGHGAHPFPGYAEVADQLVTFSGPWTDYRWSQAAPWTADHPPDRFCHLVHGVPRTHLDEAVRIARWQGAGTVWFTDRTRRGRQGEAADPWEAMPGYWDEIVSRLGPGVSE
ncbi:spherulation-specific family 4 protein [Streptomyces sp. URMC 125]|uniref:spherulation-specific family 4 protein n=1 Tax=Streptomyces sp. URMC 125 TaxID=3423419 RepID=UPI003F1B6602